MIWLAMIGTFGAVFLATWALLWPKAQPVRRPLSPLERSTMEAYAAGDRLADRADVFEGGPFRYDLDG